MQISISNSIKGSISGLGGGGSIGASLAVDYRLRVLADGGTYENGACLVPFLNSLQPDLYNDASLILYPAGDKANVLFSEKPTDGTGDLTFTRASTATRVNSSGLIESVASGVPRIDYLNGCGQLLLEPQRTNLITYSEDLGTLKWFAQNGTLVIGGSGLLFKKPSANSIKYEATGVGFNQMYFNNGSDFTTIGNDYAERFYLKVGSDIPYIYIQHSAVGGVNFSVINNITKTIKSTNVNVNSFDVEFLQDDWMLITTTLTATYAVQYASKPYFSNSSTSYSNGVPIGTTAYMTCSQFEEGSHATSYIPTSGSTVTRLQDVSTTTGLTSVIGQTEGVLYADFIHNKV